MITRADRGARPVPPFAALTPPRWRRIPALAWRTTRAQQSRSQLTRPLGYPAALLAWPRTVAWLAYARATRHLIARGDALLLLVPRVPRPTSLRSPTAEGLPEAPALVIYGIIAGTLNAVAARHLRRGIPNGDLLLSLIPFTVIAVGHAAFLIPDTSPRESSPAARRARAWAITTGTTVTEVWSPGTGTDDDQHHLMTAMTRYADAHTIALTARPHPGDTLEYLRAGFVPAPDLGARVLLRAPTPPVTPAGDR